ncbi:methyltransferase domain-containing protein [Geodermatophilus sp. YIM 151500]|uniref:class I SAM-dependent methyltransferase n=1 Tax=Geodermatophilus sp. YIM 151500 TaxID=2984531 RepID=UPI0021E4B99B|nr:methyltransferase domain-containing protein [Geodermatophilus sp. YIM 151500]MCV2490748.1 methyltransferase domain-containing protein [Geodermatophilus sp. YIM 151500]
MTGTLEIRGGWQLDEAGAAAYEEILVAALLGPWAEDLVEQVGVGTGQRVVDVGCGTGAVARAAARRVGADGTVGGYDVNDAMLAVARRVSRGSTPPIGYTRAPADALPLPDAAADAVLCQQALQFVPDPAAALAEMHRICAPGGRLGVSTCRGLAHQPGYRVLTDVLARHLGEQTAVVIRSPYALGGVAELRALVQAAGFTAAHARIVVSPCRVPSAEALLRGETASSPLGDVLERLDAGAAAALVDELTAALDPHTDDDGVLFPFETVVVTADR